MGARTAGAWLTTAAGLAAALLLALFVWQAMQAARQASLYQEAESQRVDAVVLARALEAGPGRIDSEAELRALLATTRVGAAVALYADDGGRIASAAASGLEGLVAALPDRSPGIDAEGLGPVAVASGEPALVAVRLADGRVLVTARARDQAASWVRTLVAYQALTLVVALALILFLLRRAGRRFSARRDLAAGDARGLGGGRREADFVVETFHSVIGELQVKGRELDLAHRRERERADRSERFSERVIRTMPTGLVVVDRAGRVTAANQSARDLFAALPAARAETTDHRVAFADAPQLVRMIGDCLNRGATYQRHEIEMRAGADGDPPRWLGASVSPIGPGEQGAEAALCLMTELTEVVALRDQLRLQENMAHLGEMAAGLAHELKNSLATIQGYSQLLAQLAPAGARAPSESLVGEVQYLARMVTDFLNFARPQDLSLAPVPVGGIVEDVTIRIEDRVAQAGIELVVEVAPDLAVLADELLLGRALFNIALNAVEALESSPPPRRLTLAARRASPAEVVVEIRDSGPGIPDEDLSKIFIPFFTTKSRGYGIGLALTQKIVLSHGGTIVVENTHPGTVFRCTLPGVG